MTARLKRVPLFGEGINSKSPVVTRQRRLNVYLEVRKDGEKSKIVCYGTPGLRLLFNVGTPLNLPMRGMLGNASALYVVSGNQIKSLSSLGATLQSASIGTSTGLVGMALNPTQLMVVDGSAGYVFTPSTGAVSIAGGAFPNGAKTITQCNGFFAVEQPGSNQFFVSNFNDGTGWSGLSFAAAVQAIDGLVAMDSLNGILIPMSSGHIEFWQNAGLTQEPFQYIQNSAAMYGLEAVASRVHVGESLLFLARTNGGSFQNSAGSLHIARVKGYACEIVSNDDVDQILQTMARTSTVTDCIAFAYEQDHHQFAQFTFPTANRSLLYDASTGFWGETQSGITSAYAARHLGNLCASAYRQTYVSDWQNGNVYTFDPTVYTDNGNPIVRELVTRAAIEDFNNFRISQIYLDMETGVGVASPSAPGYNPQVELSVARDNRDFGAQRLFPLGLQGQYKTRVLGRRWGCARQAHLRVRMTDPAPFTITSGAMLTSSRASRNAPRTRGGA